MRHQKEVRMNKNCKTGFIGTVVSNPRHPPFAYYGDFEVLKGRVEEELERIVAELKGGNNE